MQEIQGGLVVLSAYGLLQRTNDSAYKIEQESNFWYLCGIEEADWTLVIEGGHKSWLIMPEVDEVHRIFEGGLSATDAKTISGVDDVISSDEGKELIKRLAKQHSLVQTVGQPPYAEHYNFSLNPAMQKNWAMLERVFGDVQDCRRQMARLRAIKLPEELAMIRKAVDVSLEAFKDIHDQLPNYKNEYEIEADFARHVRFSGASGLAYDSIVASGRNACTLHYSANSSAIRAHQLVLMDMGAQCNRYAADISRTFAKGSPTKRQRAVHQAVERAHLRVIDLIEPMLSVEEYQRNVDAIMTEALAELNLPNDEAGLRRYFPHAISHGLGIDVHDSLGAPKYFQENMVLTVEPGIYISEEGIGIRIEDDILVTATGRENLSAALSTGL